MRKKNSLDWILNGRRYPFRGLGYGLARRNPALYCSSSRNMGDCSYPGFWKIMKKLYLSGKRSGRLVVLHQYDVKKFKSRWMCLCDCGKKVVINGSSLECSRTMSCGCIRIRHGMTGTPTHKAWTHMKERCLNKKLKVYQHYGSRGIKVCDRWLKFDNFLKDMGEKPPNLSIDRINNDGDYCKENCRWATKFQQSNNTRSVNRITHNGMTKTISEWALYYQISRRSLRRRFDLKWPTEKLFGIR